MFGMNFTGISAILVLKRAPSRRIVNVALLWALTYLCKIDQSMRMIRSQVVIHVKVPKHKVAFLEFVGLVVDTGIILEDKIEVGLRTSLHKIDRYFYKIISCLLWIE